MDVPFCSSTRVSGTGIYTSATLECNWNEDRVRLDAGEYVYMPLMEGATVRPEETDISIAPPTRAPGKASDGGALTLSAWQKSLTRCLSRLPSATPNVFSAALRM